jgi:two-component sensor histidine kinase
MFNAPEGQSRTVSLEGVPLLTAFTRSGLTGWTAAAGIAESTLTAPALRAFMLTGALGFGMLMIGLAFAIRMATTIARAEALHELLINELNHRVKNTMAVVQSLSAQTFRGSADRDSRNKFDARLGALGRTHDVLSANKWESADLRDVIDATLAPFESSNPGAIRKAGPPAPLGARSVVMLSMVIHELATNAAKYGALSRPGGTVDIDWSRRENGRVRLDWRERGGPPVEMPSRAGFGSRLIGQGFAAQINGTAALTFEREGVTCTLDFAGA